MAFIFKIKKNVLFRHYTFYLLLIFFIKWKNLRLFSEKQLILSNKLLYFKKQLKLL